jgi:hypothetical protein
MNFNATTTTNDSVLTNTTSQAAYFRLLEP